MSAGELTHISGLGKLSIELLETVGIESVDALSQSDVDLLLVEMTKANQILKICKKAPTNATLRKWIEQAGEICDYDPESEVVKLDTVVPDAEEVLVAIPVSGKSLMEKGIKASEVPVIEIIERQLQPEVSPLSKPSKPKPQATPKETVIKNVTASAPAEKIKPKSRKEIAPLQGKQDDRRTKVSPNLNEGKKEHARNYIRGVLYPQVGRLRLAALIAVLFFVSVPIALIGAALIVLNNEGMWAIAPAVTLVLGLLYLMVATKLKCRICGQPLYISKGCHKHVKAHHIPVIGYIFPTSVQLLLFSWFRCIYCGTSIRLKE